MEKIQQNAPKGTKVGERRSTHGASHEKPQLFAAETSVKIRRFQASKLQRHGSVRLFGTSYRCLKSAGNRPCWTQTSGLLGEGAGGGGGGGSGPSDSKTGTRLGQNLEVFRATVHSIAVTSSAEQHQHCQIDIPGKQLQGPFPSGLQREESWKAGANKTKYNVIRWESTTGVLSEGNIRGIRVR